MPAPTTDGLFANAAAAELPPDDASKANMLDLSQKSDTPNPMPNAEQEEAAAAAQAAEQAAKDKSAEEAKAKAAEAEKSKAADLTNPNLTAKEKEVEESKTGDDDDKKPAGMTDKAFVSWKAKNAEVKQSRAEAQTAREELNALKTQLEEAKKTAPQLDSLKKELEEAKQRLADYEGEISITRIEGTKQFKDTVSTPMTEITTSLTELAKRYEIEDHTLLRAIQEPDAGKRAEALEKLTEDFKTVDRLEVVQAAKDWQKLQRTAAEMRSDAGKRLEQITKESAQEDEKRATLTTQDYRNAVTSEWDAVQQSIPEVRRVEGHDQWNAHLDGIRRAAESVDVNGLPVEEVAKMKVAQLILPEVRSVAKHFQTQFQKEKERADKAEKQLADYLKTAPGAGAGGHESSSSKNGSGLFADTVLTGV